MKTFVDYINHIITEYEKIQIIFTSNCLYSGINSFALRKLSPFKKSESYIILKKFLRIYRNNYNGFTWKEVEELHNYTIELFE